GLGAPIAVLEPVEVLRLVGALVLIVLVSVTVAVTDRRLEHEAEHEPDVRGLEAARVDAAAAAHHPVAVLLDEELDAADVLLRKLLLARRVAVEQVRAVPFGDEIERVEHTVGETETEGGEIAVLEPSLLELRLPREIVAESRVLAGVPAVADVEAHVEAAQRAEVIFDDERGPVPKPGVGTEVARRIPERDARLHDGGHADTAVDAREAQLAVNVDAGNLLRVESLGVVQVSRRAYLVSVVARHQDHGDGDPADTDVGDTVVEAEGALERVLDERRHPRAGLPVQDHAVFILASPIRIHRIRIGGERDAARARAQQIAAVVEDQPEADVAAPEDVGAVDREKPLRIHGGPEQVGIHARTVGLGHTLFGGHLRARIGREQREHCEHPDRPSPGRNPTSGQDRPHTAGPFLVSQKPVKMRKGSAAHASTSQNPMSTKVSPTFAWRKRA